MSLDDELLREARDARDRLIAAQHEVDAAREAYHHAIGRLCAAGGTLREIAEELGLSHQRVHQIVEEGRHRLGDEARAVLMAAHAEAGRLRHDVLGAEHLLLGLLTVRGLDATAARSAVQDRLGKGGRRRAPGILRVDDRAKRVLDEASGPGAEELLAALRRTGVLDELGVDAA
ncbi:MAG: hypothetical protein ICV67_08110 [Thermoleophilia bacterium]|nr:hypothetical protein [Thermoleophilia bacterium]